MAALFVLVLVMSARTITQFLGAPRAGAARIGQGKPAAQGQASQSAAAASGSLGRASETAHASGALDSGSAPELTATVRARWLEFVGRELPESFATPQEQRFYALCLDFTRALNAEAERLDRSGTAADAGEDEAARMTRAVARVRAAPPASLAEADLSFCSEYTIESFHTEASRAVAEEVQSTLQALGGAMSAAYEQGHKLCPSSTAPVPTKLDLVLRGPYNPKAEDWSDETWRCLHFRWLRPMRFQFGLQAEQNHFTFVARGSLGGDGRLDEYRLQGSVDAGHVTLGDVTGRLLEP